MVTVAGNFNPPELTAQQFAFARRQTMLTGACDMHLHENASAYQRDVLHQIELTVKSINEDHLIE